MTQAEGGLRTQLQQRSLKTRFPDWPLGTLERTACEHAAQFYLAYGCDPDFANVDRLVVNMLRHEFTDYDDDQTRTSHAAACRAIAARYPWLGVECERQVKRRAEAQRIEAEFARMAEEMEREERRRRLRRSEESARLIAFLKVGDCVTTRIDGHERVGLITWVGRRRVEISYNLKTGEPRKRRLYASEVEPVKDLQRDGVDRSLTRENGLARS